MEKYRRARQVTDDYMGHAIASLISKATKTDYGYVIGIAFPRHEWLHERASMLPL